MLNCCIFASKSRCPPHVTSIHAATQTSIYAWAIAFCHRLAALLGEGRHVLFSQSLAHFWNNVVDENRERGLPGIRVIVTTCKTCGHQIMLWLER